MDKTKKQFQEIPNVKLAYLKPQIRKKDGFSNENGQHIESGDFANLQCSTPFRCSLSHQLAITRGKKQSISRRTREEKKITNEQKSNNIKRESKEPSSLLLKLPKLSYGARPLVTVTQSSNIHKNGGIYEFFNPRNARENWENKSRLIRREKSDLFNSQRSYEEVMKCRERHLMSSNLLKSSNVRTTTLPQLVRKNDLTYFEYKSAEEGKESDEERDDDDLESLEYEDFCKTFKDGSKLVGYNRKLSIEVFMPKI